MPAKTTNRKRTSGTKRKQPRASERATTHVIKIGEARERLSQIANEVGTDASPGVVVGSRGKPTLMCISYERYRPLLTLGNRTEKLALLVVEELLFDAPLHIRTPAVEELSRLSMGDLQLLYAIGSFPLSTRAANTIKRQMENPAALDRLAQRARVAAVLAEAHAAGLYEAIGDEVSGVVAEK